MAIKRGRVVTPEDEVEKARADRQILRIRVNQLRKQVTQLEKENARLRLEKLRRTDET